MISYENPAKDEYASYLFGRGENYYSYDYLGCHAERRENKYAYTFRVWAPSAVCVYLIGDITSWDDGAIMTREDGSGIWSVTVLSDTDRTGDKYKYKIVSQGGTFKKADPYAFFSENGSQTASIIRDISGYEWKDSEYINEKRKSLMPDTGHFVSAPVNIYEAHLGSWKTRDGESNEDGKHYLTYRELADELSAYLKQMNYTHIELMPVSEYPYDGSWGYQCCGYFSPTSRFGTPQDFMYFVDRLHENGIGVILDWVPAHFPKDEHGLYMFDGTPLYEYADERRREMKGWGTHFFDVGKNEVRSFLISDALFWMRKYHIDGLRVDAVASMLYLDYDRAPGEWEPNKYGTNTNLEAVEFFKALNKAVFAEFPYALMTAEESTAFASVTKPTELGGLGFNFKWNMGWANDMYSYLQTDPFFRKHCHDKLTFPMMYAYSENYILPVSHDEVVHGKKSLIGKMFGDYEQKFDCMRAFLAYMMTFPGKKMLFMGTEFAQYREWDYKNQLEWFMLGFNKHACMKRFVKELNSLYLQRRELWEIDDSWDGFKWIEADQSELNIISYRRFGLDGSELIAVINFAPVRREGYEVRLEKKGGYRLIFSSDNLDFGGYGSEICPCVKRVNENHRYSYRLNINLPSYGALVFEKIK